MNLPDSSVAAHEDELVHLIRRPRAFISKLLWYFPRAYTIRRTPGRHSSLLRGAPDGKGEAFQNRACAE
jgi:hypothetical protein